MKTIERNYTKNPHTARFLQTFHTAVGTNGVNYREGIVTETEALELEASQDADLLDLIPADHVADLRSPAQTALIEKLIRELGELDAELGGQARTYTDGMTEHGKWTPGREGNTSRWISNLIDKIKVVRADARRAAPVAPTTTPEIPAGRYGIERDGEVKCYSLAYGKPGTQWDGFTFLARISSDDEFPIRRKDEKAAILAAIGQDVEAARVLAALTLRRCARCNRQLSDTKNPYFHQGLGPECGTK